MPPHVPTIGKYLVERVLGRGSTGTVYLARDPGFDRRVAVKQLTSDPADAPELRMRFLREAEAAGGLRHPNIVTVYDVGEDAGQPYIAMEYVEGVDLEHIIHGREPYSIEWTLDVLRQVCDGLGHAHRNGIVHRDVKPANIRVTPAGEVKIMDFGLARLPSSTATKSGRLLGTVQYMAPEQVEGADVDGRADIFSVGAIAYELLAHRKPFQGDSLAAVMFQILHGAPDPAALPETAYSPGLERIILKALARDRTLRYPSLEAMHADLASLVRAAAKVLPAPPEP
jgi:eukaryotic-like serine/threonine-protein kinase